MDSEKLAALGLRILPGKDAKIDAQYVALLEETVGFSLPDNYKEFLNSYGPSLFTKRVVFRPLIPSPWAAVDGLQRLDVLYGCSIDSRFDVLQVSIRLADDMPNQTLVIGHDPMGNHLLLGADGTVHFLDRETGKTFLCARDFGSFLNSFESWKGREKGDRFEWR